jgi:DNA invertase Pin-like site-specific DNA recombinase
MGAVRDRNPKECRATAYVRISAEEPLSSASKQKNAIHLYAKTQKLHIALVCSDPRRTKHR